MFKHPVYLISAHTIQKEIECTKAKKLTEQKYTVPWSQNGIMLAHDAFGLIFLTADNTQAVDPIISKIH